jgi:hypothetical protein
MRIRLVPAALAAATIALFCAGHAAAGGPTSVIVVNPVTGEAGALYYDDPDYQLLQEALEPWPDGWVEQPGQLSAGPGTAALNITWLIHDVSVWRVDHIRLDLKYVWVQTNLATEGTVPYDGGGQSWHVAADAQAVVDVLDRLGVLPDEWKQSSGSDINRIGADELLNTGPATEPKAQPAEPNIVPDWQWIAAAAAGGIALGVGGRPAVRAILRRREASPRQQLVDVTPPERSELDSGQADPDPAKAASLVLDLGDLYPADLSR